ncbi:phage baseplate plug family protein [Salibacterium halotolerans]|uniref:Cyanophage baseplate Pam3 plug gp18 domain-containing protein n=1 Tax=Salibacterium halotolerans TaxID=1884432 RepID=A0A1I5NBD7_9BACI|nr:hypothetical protein [Salibacterium halotolerans]SFP19010.1 hypothetical protein SAMN05518683_10366 [Salibacterium halotolerans]
MAYLPFFRDQVPFSYEIELAGATFELEYHYNSKHDYYTVDLRRNGEILAAGQKIVYGKPLFDDYVNEDFPEVTIVPRDPSGNNTEVNRETLGQTVFLMIEDGEGDA